MEIPHEAMIFKAKLPGFVQLFLAQMYISVVYCVLIFLAGLYLWWDRLGSIWLGSLYIPTVIVGALLAWVFWLTVRCITAIHARSAEAIDRCRFFLKVCLVFGAILVLVTLFLIAAGPDNFLSRYSTWAESIGFLPRMAGQALLGMLLAFAWLRYFAESPNVLRTFRGVEAAKLLPESPPSEITIFRIVCYGVMVYYGFSGLISLYAWWNFFPGETPGGQWVQMALNVGVNIALPLCALAALNGRRCSGVFWCLGLWMGVQFVRYVLVMISMAALGQDLSAFDNYSGAVAAHIAIAVVFWWYFYTSEKALAWFSGGQPGAEQRN